MNNSQFWKNFNLGTELGIAGRFIYNGLRTFHEIDSLYHDDEVFEVLYNLAVGLERLLKIAVVLIEHDTATNQEEFERSLITHTHLDLLARVRSQHKLNLGLVHNEFLQLLGTFYNTHRYGRYSVTSVEKVSIEKHALHAFIEKYLQIKIADDMIFATRNDTRIRKFLGRTTGKIVGQLYETIRSEADRLRVYTHEVRNHSKAAKIFLSEEFDFTTEEALWRELVVFLVNSKRTIGHVGFLRTIEPLPFDPELEGDYLQCFASTEKMLLVTEELEGLYEEIDKPGERLETIGVIGNPLVHFADTEEESDDRSDEHDESDEELD